MLQEIYYLRLHAAGCFAEAWLNGIAVSRVDPVYCRLDGRPVHDYLLPAKNIVTLVVSPGALAAQPFAPAAPDRGPPGRVAPRALLAGPRGVLPDDPAVRKLASLVWRPAPGAVVSPPVLLNAEAELPVWLPSWSWLEATPVAPSPELNQLVFVFVRRLAEGFRGGDPSLYLQFAGTRFREVAQAYAVKEEDTRTNFLRQWESVSARDGFQFSLPDPAQLAVRVMAGGKMLDCIDANFQPILRAEPLENGSTPLLYPLRLSFFGRDVCIVR
jgi:hypothetical protein